jgi:hypothetical protein
MTNMRVIATGSREYPSKDTVWEALAWVVVENLTAGDTLTVVHGAAAGADEFAHMWCQLPADDGVIVVEERHPADWARFGKSAGPRRNAEIVALGADLVIAFPLPGPRERSRGTWDCIDRAEAAGIPVEVKELEFQPRFSFDDVAEAVGREARP